MDSKELQQIVTRAIDDNFICQAEDHCRKLEWQLDRIEIEQGHLKTYIEESLNPVLTEIRDALRAKGNEHGNH